MKAPEELYCSAKNAANKLGVTTQRVYQLIADGRLTAVRVGSLTLVSKHSVTSYQHNPNRELYTPAVIKHSKKAA